MLDPLAVGAKGPRAVELVDGKIELAMRLAQFGRHSVGVVEVGGASAHFGPLKTHYPQLKRQWTCRQWRNGPRHILFLLREDSMKKGAAAVDERQTVIPIDLPPGPRLSSDDRARSELLAMIEALATARAHPWSARLLGWQLRRFNALKQMLTPLDAAALSARFDAELERLGAPQD
jgi:hypothetical protein